MSTHYNALDLHDAHEAVIQDVMTERARQLNKFGSQDRPPFEWFLILSEEVGEVAKECVEMQFNDANHPNSNPEAYRKELVEVAAVALAALQNFDQRKALAERMSSQEGQPQARGLERGTAAGSAAHPRSGGFRERPQSVSAQPGGVPG